ncbi:hypothetical protein PHISP_03558 [Aspergillus sp. HF37]|nr:hypothetical protein PHISP_03558 [Aspergillus sp. HF37]
MSFLSNVSDFASSLSHAQSDSGSSSESQDSLFNTAISHLDSRKHEYSETEPEVDEEGYMRAHQSVFDGEGETHDSGTVGTGAAMQALKMFTSGSGGGGGGGMDKNVMIGMAMSQAGKLWEEKNGQGSVSGDKQSAVNSAAEAAMKMYIKSQYGIGGTGGPSGLMGMASKFL